MLSLFPYRYWFDILFSSGCTVDGSEAYLFLRGLTDNSELADILCACMLVSKLPHAADALYLVVEESPDVQSSRHAWSVARTQGIVPNALLLIRAMRLLLLRFPLHEWLHDSELRCTRSLEEWSSFALQFIEDRRFTDRWHAEHGSSMYTVLVAQAKQELRDLEDVLRIEERNRITSIRQAKRQAIGDPRPFTKISFSDEQAIKMESEHQLSVHTDALGLVQRLLDDDVPTAVLDSQFSHVASIIIAFATEYPALRWNFKLAFHMTCYMRLSHSPWWCERELCRQQAAVPNPLHALKQLTR